MWIFHNLGRLFGCSFLFLMYFCFWMLSPKHTKKKWLGDYIVCSTYRMLFKSCTTTFPQKHVFSCAVLCCWRFSVLPQSSTLFGSYFLISDQTDPWGSERWDLKLFTSIFTIFLSSLKAGLMKKQTTVKPFRPVFRTFWTTGAWKLENWGARPWLSVAVSVLWDLGNLPSFQTWTLALSMLTPRRTNSVCAVFHPHKHTYVHSVSKERIWARRPAGRPSMFPEYTSSGLCGLAKKPI